VFGNTGAIATHVFGLSFCGAIGAMCTRRASNAPASVITSIGSPSVATKARVLGEIPSAQVRTYVPSCRAHSMVSIASCWGDTQRDRSEVHRRERPAWLGKKVPLKQVAAELD